MTEYYNDVLDEADADLVQVAQAPVTNINAALEVGGKISGHRPRTRAAPRSRACR